jgi:hypothetical protein
MCRCRCTDILHGEDASVHNACITTAYLYHVAKLTFTRRYGAGTPISQTRFLIFIRLSIRESLNVRTW